MYLLHSFHRFICCGCPRCCVHHTSHQSYGICLPSLNQHWVGLVIPELCVRLLSSPSVASCLSSWVFHFSRISANIKNVFPICIQFYATRLPLLSSLVTTTLFPSDSSEFWKCFLNSLSHGVTHYFNITPHYLHQALPKEWPPNSSTNFLALHFFSFYHYIRCFHNISTDVSYFLGIIR